MAVEPLWTPVLRLAELPPDWQTAALSRCALRVLPAVRPERSTPPEQQARQMRTAFTCCTAAILETFGRDISVPRPLLAQALGAAAFDTGAQSVAAVRLARAVAELQALPRRRAVDARLLQTYRQCGRNWESSDAFDSSFDSDVDALDEVWDRKAPKLPVPPEFFARPLFLHAPAAPWKATREEWNALLDTLGLGDLVSTYEALLEGRADLDRVLATTLDGPRQVAKPDNDIAPTVAHSPDTPPEAASAAQQSPESPYTAAPPKSEATLTAHQEPPGASKPPDSWMLSDRPIEGSFADEDRFRFGDYADALATILDHPKTDTPFTMAINAPWGAGKTTLANMIVAELQRRPVERGEAPPVICWFNAWMHDDAPNLATALVAEVSRTADAHRPSWRRFILAIPEEVMEPAFRRLRRVTGAAVGLALVALLAQWTGQHLQHIEDQRAYAASTRLNVQATSTVTTDAAGQDVSRSQAETIPQTRQVATRGPQPAQDTFDPLFSRVQAQLAATVTFLTAIAALVGVLWKLLASTPLGRFLKAPEKAAEAGAITHAARQVRDLIDEATSKGNRFVVFIDDIERCKPPRSLDVLDAVNQILGHRNVITVVLGDMAAVAAAAQLKYKDLADLYVPNAGIAQTGADAGKEAFGRLYLQKIVQFQFDLPIPSKEAIRDYMGHLAAGEPRDTDG